jgi:hypothetical protein
MLRPLPHLTDWLVGGSLKMDLVPGAGIFGIDRPPPGAGTAILEVHGQGQYITLEGGADPLCRVSCVGVGIVTR